MITWIKNLYLKSIDWLTNNWFIFSLIAIAVIGFIILFMVW